MDTKLLYKVGNLFRGYPYGVEVELEFGSHELHGPFKSENDANTYMHRLVDESLGTPFVGLKVVKIETPQVGKRIVRNDANTYEYAV